MKVKNKKKQGEALLELEMYQILTMYDCCPSEVLILYYRMDRKYPELVQFFRDNNNDA